MNTLTKEQEAQAFALIKAGGPGGERAREQFIVLNQPLVGHVAKRYRDKGISWAGLLAAGKYGLLRAVDGFDPSLGNKFSSYAVKWIEGEIKQAFISAERQDLFELESFVVNHDPKAPESGPREKEAGELELDWSACEIGADSDLAPLFEQAIERLGERHRQVVAMRLGLCGYETHTLAEIGKALGVSEQRANELQAAALKQLRQDPALEMILELTR